MRFRQIMHTIILILLKILGKYNVSNKKNAMHFKKSEIRRELAFSLIAICKVNQCKNKRNHL